MWHCAKTNKNDESGIMMKQITHDQLSTVDNNEKLTQIGHSNLFYFIFNQIIRFLRFFY